MKLFIMALFISQSAYSVCLTNRSIIDLNCSCRSNNSCRNITGKRFKISYKKQARAVGKKTAKKFTGMELPLRKDIARFYAGERTSSENRTDKFAELRSKLGTFNKKYRKHLEKNYKKRGIKPYKIDQRVAKYNKKMDKIIPQKMKDYIAKKGLPSRLLAKKLGLKSDTNFAMATHNISPQKIMDQIQRSSQSEEVQKAISKVQTDMFNRDFKRLDNQVKSVMSKKFKKAVLLEKNDDLFKSISKRYKDSQDRLDQKTITLYSLDVTPEKMFSNISSIADSFE